MPRHRLHGLRRLSALERRWLHAVFETMLPADEVALAPAPRDVPLDRFVDDFLRRAPLEVGIGLRLALWLVTLAPPFLLGRMRTFAGLDAAGRLAVLRRMSASEAYLVREMPLLLKMVACLGYCGVPDVQARLGIPLGAGPAPAWLGDAKADVGGGTRASLDTRPAGARERRAS